MADSDAWESPYQVQLVIDMANDWVSVKLTAQFLCHRRHFRWVLCPLPIHKAHQGARLEILAHRPH